MRLIDADELRKKLSTISPLYANDEYDYCTKDILDKVDDLIQSQPTAYDVDNVLNTFEKYKSQQSENEMLSDFGKHIVVKVIDVCMKVVKAE